MSTSKAHSSDRRRVGRAGQRRGPVVSAESKPDGKRGVQLVVDEPGRRVDVLVDGQPFTSYIWPTTLKKPVLYPLRTSAGTVVTRGYPLEPRAGERVDHPHHVGLWLNHGDVNGLDFWNNSDAIAAADAAKYGTIVHRAIKSAKSGPDKGELQVTEDWVTPDGKALLREDTTYVFHGGAGPRGDRPPHHAHRPRREGRLPRQQGRHARPARDARPRAAVRQGGDLHRRERQGHQRGQARQHRRDRPLHQQRGQDRRRGLGHARALDDAARARSGASR